MCDFDKSQKTDSSNAKKNRSWVFTHNNPSETDIVFLREKFTLDCEYLIFGEECGEECHTPHLQGYFELPNARTWKSLMKQFKFCYLATRRGTVDQCINYCSKEGKQVEFGERPKQGQRKDLLEIQKMIDLGVGEKEIAQNHFSQWIQYGKRFEAYRLLTEPKRTWKTEVEVYWGASGTGKSKKAFEDHPEADVVKYTKGDFIIGYTGSDTVIWEEFDPCECPRALFLTLTDRYKCNINIKGGERNWKPKRIIFTSNHDPKSWYSGEACPEAVQRRISTVLFFGTK